MDKKDITNDIERKIDIICNEFKPAAKKRSGKIVLKLKTQIVNLPIYFYPNFLLNLK